MDSVGELASKNEERETVVKVDQEIGQNSGEIQSIKDDVGIAHVEAMAIFQDGMSALIKVSFSSSSFLIEASCTLECSKLPDISLF